MALNDWMGDLSPNLKLTEITMPGSHDAGVYVEDATSVRNVSLSRTICQSASIGDQCRMGSRFFDIRLMVHGQEAKGYHMTAGFGAVGGTADRMLGEVRAFLDTNQSECVILRISKTKASTGVLNKVSAILGDRLYKGRGNIAKKTLHDLAGKAICVFDNESFAGYINQPIGIHPFYKHKNPGTMGLTTCGEYTGKSSIRKVIAKQLSEMDSHVKHSQNDHLFVLYWTQTGGNVREHTEKALNPAKAARKNRATGGTHHNMDYMLQLIVTGQDRHGENWSVTPTTWQDRRDCMPHVIMYDFINPETSGQIIGLNDPGLRAHLTENAEAAEGEAMANAMGNLFG